MSRPFAVYFRTGSLVVSCLFAIAVLLVSSPRASAQTTSRTGGQTPARPSTSQPAQITKWEVEIQVGAAGGAGALAGISGTAFPVGTTFAAVNGLSTRATSSWFFGDGATLLNQLGAGFSGFPASTRIVPLNPALTAASLTRGTGASFGVRVGRRLTSKLRTELVIDSRGGSLRFTDSAKQQIEATRASFTPMWNAIIATGGGVIFTSPTVTATTTFVDNVSRRQTIVAGVGTFELGRRGRLAPYLSGGAGVLMNSGDTPSVTLTGRYRFTINFSQPAGASVPFDETDVAKVHFGQKDNVAIGLFGGGVRYYLRPRQGLRLDLGFEVGADPIDTLVNATPATVQGAPSGWIPSNTSPAIQLSNTTTSARSNLSDPAIANLRTFVGQGAQSRVHFTIGYFFRF